MRGDILIIIIGICFFSFQEKKYKEKEKREVYICKSVKSKRYHYKKNCKGLFGCKSTIKKTTKKKAEKFGRILCKRENK